MADAHAAQQFRLGLAQQRQRDQNRELISRRSHVLPVAALRRVAGLRSLQDAVGSDRPLFGKDSAYLAPRGSRLTVAQAGGWAEPAGAA